jgi:hypothetical protein
MRRQFYAAVTAVRVFLTPTSNMTIGRALRLSAFEAAFIFVLSNAAFPILVFVHHLNIKGEVLSVQSVFEIIFSNISPTENIVYILALLAPALWIMYYRWRARRHPLFFFSLLSVQAVIVVTSAIIYAVAKTGKVQNTEFASNWALGCYVTGLVIWYITLVYDKVLTDIRVPEPPESGAKILQELGSS